MSETTAEERASWQLQAGGHLQPSHGRIRRLIAHVDALEAALALVPCRDVYNGYVVDRAFCANGTGSGVLCAPCAARQARAPTNEEGA
jgi:hypothetical protein